MPIKRELIWPAIAVICGIALVLGFGAFNRPPPAAKPAFKLPPDVQEIKWEQLIPKDWNPRATLDKLGVGKRQDNDPQAKEILAKIRAEWDRAPVVQEWNGKKVRLTGYVVVLEGDENGTTEFLLVPFYGSCIHVPPPPSNQVVHVVTNEPVAAAVMFNSVWVMGTLTTVQAKTSLASAGYQIKGAQVGDLSDSQ